MVSLIIQINRNKLETVPMSARIPITGESRKENGLEVETFILAFADPFSLTERRETAGLLNGTHNLII